MTLVEFAIFPTDKGVSVSKYVSKVIKLIKDSGLSYKLTPMGTILEGEYDNVMKVVSDCFHLLEKDSERIYMTLTMDYRKGNPGRIESKVDKIKTILNEDIST